MTDRADRFSERLVAEKMVHFWDLRDEGSDDPGSGVRRKPGRLRQVRFAVTETERGAPGRPRQRHAAAAPPTPRPSASPIQYRGYAPLPETLLVVRNSSIRNLRCQKYRICTLSPEIVNAARESLLISH